VSLIGFKAQNHPQQTVKDQVDDRGTDPTFFAAMSEEFGPFDLDVAAAPHNAKCPRYYTLEDDGLARSWHGTVWCNPPYSKIHAWVAKAWNQWTHNPCGPTTIVMLLPANRTEQRWWQELVEPHRDINSAFRVRFLPGRMRFDRPGAVIGPKGDRPPFGCCLLIWTSTKGNP
jgi:phage N-6-adenine-methyltransferase